MKIFFSTFIVLLCVSTVSSAQMKRERAFKDRPVQETFWSPNVISTSTVSNIPKGNMNILITHTFGTVNSGIGELFGLDPAANIRLGMDIGLTDRLSVGFGRTRFQKVLDFRAQYALLRQMESGKIPVSVSVKGDVGLTTDKNGFSFLNRLNYFGSVLIARKFNETLSLQVTPMFAHFNRVTTAQENKLVALGISGKYSLSRRYALTFEYIPVLTKRNEGTTDAFGIGLEIETGGHVFQLFFTSTQWHLEQYAMAQTNDSFWGGDIRFGFNVNRVFGIF